MSVRFSGVWPAMVTPFDEDGQPSFSACEQLVELFCQQRLGGIYVVGSTGQWPLLALEERRAIAECVVRASSGRLPVMVHVGTPNTADAVALARHAAEIGADAVSAVGPTYFAYTPEAIFSYYTHIGRATDLPLFAYHLAGVHHLSLGPREYASRLLDVPNAAGMKITSCDLNLFGLIHGVAGDRLTLFSGADEVMCHALLSGASGAIGSFYNLWGAECQSARAALAAGRVIEARDFMIRFQSAIADVLSHGGIWSFLTVAMRLKHGIAIGRPRSPLDANDQPWTDADVQAVLVKVDEASRLVS